MSFNTKLSQNMKAAGGKNNARSATNPDDYSPRTLLVLLCH